MAQKFKTTGKYNVSEYKLTKNFLTQTEPDDYGDKIPGVWRLALSELRKRTMGVDSGGTYETMNPGLKLTLIDPKTKKVIRSRDGFSFYLKARQLGCATFSKKDFAAILKAAKVKRG